MAADDRNIFNEIRYNFNYLSQIDEHINKVIQECNQKGVDILLTLVETMRVEHEDVKKRLRDFVEVFCSPNNIDNIQNLEVFQLEREVDRVVRTQSEELLGILMTVLEGLSKEEEDIIGCINDMVAHFGVARIPKYVADVAEESNKREERLKDITTSLEGLYLSEMEKKTIDDMIKQFAQAKKIRLEREGSNIDRSGDNQSLEGGDAEKTLRDVIIGMYGFRPSVAKNIMRFVENRKMINKASKNQQKGIKLDVQKEEPGSFTVSDVLKPEGSGALDWEIVGILREKFEALKKRIQDEVKRFREKGSEGVPKCRDLFHEKHEILKVVKSWVFRLEYNFCQLINNVYAMMLVCEAAATKFQEFKSAMENLKSCHHGLVPISVYKVLAMPALPCQEGGHVEAGLVPTEKPEPSSARIDKGLLHEEIEFDRPIDLFQEIILQFRFALIASGLPNVEAQNMESEVLDSCEKALKQSEEALKEIERKMNRPKAKLEELPAGKGKTIRESTYISPQ